MSRPIITVVAGDTLPAIRGQIYDTLSGAPINLSSADIDVFATMREAGSDESLATITLAKIDNGWNGWWRLAEWPAAALDVEPGNYELQIYYTDGDLLQTARNAILMKVKEKFTVPA